MKRTLLLSFVAAIAGCLAVQAQTTNPLIKESLQNYNAVKGNLQKMAEGMPEDDYSFKPVPEIRSFGELMAHIADTQASLCSAVLGERQSVGAASKTSKADLVAALQASTDMCDKAFASITDANATEMAGRRSKLGTLIYNTTHDNEEYGYGSVYYRLKGLVPPSTAGRGMGGMKKQ